MNSRKISIKSNNAQRVYYFDVLRAIACLMVVIIHVGVVYSSKNFGSFNFWIGDIFVSISRVAVPLFVMISGALMLDENYFFSVKKLIKHIRKMALFFFFWSFVNCFTYQVLMPLLQNKKIDLYKVFTEIIEGPYHLWFIYLIIGLYLLVPILRLFVKKENKRVIEYFLILSFIFVFFVGEIIRVGSHFSEVFVFLNDHLFNKIGLQFVSGYTSYFILGWYLHNFSIPKKKFVYGLGVCGLIYTIWSTYGFSVMAGEPLSSNNNLSFCILAQSVAFFVFVQNYTSTPHQENGVCKKIIGVISKYSLGVYALHVLVFTTMLDVFSKIGLDNALIVIPLNVTISFVVSLLISLIAGRIPVIRNFVK